jgi:hypothetical protein
MKLKNMKTFEEHSSELNISDVSDSNKMVGKNIDFVVIFDTQNQKYNVYYKGKFLISREKLVDVKSYLD